MKYTTDEGLRKLRAIAERAYVRGSETCKVSPLALMAALDEIKAAQQNTQPGELRCAACTEPVSPEAVYCYSCYIED